MKCLYTNVPLQEAIEIVLQKLYSQESPPEIQRATMKRLLNMAVSKVYFQCNDSWYVQVDFPRCNSGELMAERVQVCSKTRNTGGNRETAGRKVAAGKSHIDQRGLNARVAETGII